MCEFRSVDLGLGAGRCQRLFTTADPKAVDRSTGFEDAQPVDLGHIEVQHVARHGQRREITIAEFMASVRLKHHDNPPQRLFQILDARGCCGDMLVRCGCGNCCHPRPLRASSLLGILHDLG